MLNPDKTLSRSEKRMESFLRERKVDWCGTQRKTPTGEQFTSILKENDIFL